MKKSITRPLKVYSSWWELHRAVVPLNKFLELFGLKAPGAAHSGTRFSFPNKYRSCTVLIIVPNYFRNMKDSDVLI